MVSFSLHRNAKIRCLLGEWQNIHRNLLSWIATFHRQRLRTSRKGKSSLLLYIDVNGWLTFANPVEQLVLNVFGTLDQPDLRIDGEGGLVRQPAVCGTKFDVITQDRLWHGRLSDESKKMTVEEVSSSYPCLV